MFIFLRIKILHLNCTQLFSLWVVWDIGSNVTRSLKNSNIKKHSQMSPTSEAPCTGRRPSPPRRCRCPNCDHTFASANLSPLILYPTDRKGQADLTAVHKYSFAARLVKPHPRSYRTFRSGHMQWCRYEDDLMKLPLCLQFEVAFAAPDRHRIKRALKSMPLQRKSLHFQVTGNI